MRTFPAAFLLILSLFAQLSAGAAPDILVLRNSDTIANGSTDTVYGGVTGNNLAVGYVVANVGTAPLNLTGPVAIASTNNCTATVSTSPDATIAAGSSSPFVVSVLPTPAGTWSFTIAVPNDDTVQAWTVTGTSSSTLAQEIALSRGGIGIPSGATDTITGTGLGIYEDLAYVIRNIGNAPLLITSTDLGSTASCLITVTASPSGMVGPGGSTTATVRIQPLSNPWTASVRFNSDDSDESVYVINLAGVSATSATTPEIEISHAGTTIIGGSNHGLSGGTAGTESPLYGFSVSNRGAPNLTGVAVTFPRSINCTPRLSLVPSTTVPTSFSTPGEVAITPSSNTAWQCDIAIASNDPNELSTVFTLSGTATAGGGPGGGDDASGGGGCGAGAIGGLILALSLFGLRRRR